MANPARITISDCVLNGSLAQPVTQVFDMNGEIPYAVGAKADCIILEIMNTAATGLTVTLKGSNWGNNPPMAYPPLDKSFTFSAVGGGTAKQYLGPFESFRFMQDDGYIRVGFQADSGSPAGTIRAYRIPQR